MTLTPRLDAAAALTAELEKALAEGGVLARTGARLSSGIDMPRLDVAPEQAPVLIQALKTTPQFAFEQLVYVTATDETPEEPRFRVVYHLFSFTHRWRIRVNATVAENATISSVVHLYPGASWQEREVFDMFGIRFDGHPDLRRILMPEDYGWHPLLKEFPLEGIAPDRLYREWEKQAHASADAKNEHRA